MWFRPSIQIGKRLYLSIASIRIKMEGNSRGAIGEGSLYPSRMDEYEAGAACREQRLQQATK